MPACLGFEVLEKGRGNLNQKLIAQLEYKCFAQISKPTPDLQFALGFEIEATEMQGFVKKHQEISFQNTEPNLDFYEFLWIAKPNQNRIITEKIVQNFVF